MNSSSKVTSFKSVVTSVVMFVLLTGCATDSARRPIEPATERPLVSIEFDDGWRSAYLLGLPMVERFGWTATQYVITDTAQHNATYGVGAYMSPDEIIDWNERGDVGSHTVTHPHLPKLSEEAVTDQLSASKAYLDGLLEEPTELLAAPYCETDQVVRALAAELYAMTRGCDGRITVSDQFDPHAVSSVVVLHSTSDRQLRDLLKVTKASHGWLVLVWHEITDEPGDYATPPARLRDELALVAKSHIAVVPTAVAFREMRHRSDD
jgi:peptidoglycan/xylan/chitin deacetylase (PgdA/CDA1 family)